MKLNGGWGVIKKTFLLIQRIEIVINHQIAPVLYEECVCRLTAPVVNTMTSGCTWKKLLTCVTLIKVRCQVLTRWNIFLRLRYLWCQKETSTSPRFFHVLLGSNDTYRSAIIVIIRVTMYPQPGIEP